MSQDRFYVPNTEEKRSLSEQGFHEFRETLYDDFHDAAKQAVLNAVRKERDLEQVRLSSLSTSSVYCHLFMCCIVMVW